MPASNTYGLDPHQYAYAADIVASAKQMGMSVRDAQIAIMTALTESGLRELANTNVPASLQYPHDGTGSDHASLGDFQQQTPGWGSVAELMQPHVDHVKFLEALKSKPDRYSIQPWQAAQEVQNSAYSDGSNYRANWPQAQSIASGLWASANNGTPGAGGLATTGAPYDPSTLHPPLSPLQRATIIAWLVAQPSNSSTAAQLAQDDDAGLITTYKDVLAGGGSGSGPTSTTNGPLNAIGKAATSLTGMLAGFGKVFDGIAWLFNPDHFMRFLLYVLGSGAVIAGLFMIARSTKD